MRMMVFVAASIAFALSCVMPSQPYSQGQGGTYPQQGTYPQEQAATCDGACSHYLQCKGVNDPNVFQMCVGECQRLQVTPDQLAQYQQTDCTSAIQIVEGSQNRQQPQAGTDCQGCVRDGNSCVWISQSNWGRGPYSGAVSSCASSCCGL
jgi:hypothetical protein